MPDMLIRPAAKLRELQDLRDAADKAEGLPRLELATSPGAVAPASADPGPGWTVHVAPIIRHPVDGRAALVLRRRYLAHLGKVRRVKGRDVTITDRGRVPRTPDWDPVRATVAAFAVALLASCGGSTASHAASAWRVIRPVICSAAAPREGVRSRGDHGAPEQQCIGRSMADGRYEVRCMLTTP